MRYVAYYSNGWIYTGSEGWSLGKTRDRAQGVVRGTTPEVRVIAVVAHKVP